MIITHKNLYLLLRTLEEIQQMFNVGGKPIYNQTIQQTEQLPNWPVMLSNLNTSQISSGVFIDKITIFANILNYNTTEKNFSNGEHFKQALSELYRASEETKFIGLALKMNS